MSGLKETITKAIGNSEFLSKAADFLSDTQKRFKATQALNDAKIKLTNLYLELGKTAYKKKPLSPSRTSAVIRAEIDAAIIEIDTLEQILDELNAPSPEDSEIDGDVPDNQNTTK